MKKIINIILVLLMIVIFYYRDGSDRRIDNVTEIMISYPESTVITNNSIIKINMENIYKWDVIN